MRYLTTVLIAIGFSTADSAPAAAQQLMMSQVMTAEELKTSGIESLTAEQRAAFGSVVEPVHSAGHSVRSEPHW